ncbi:MAG: 1,4-dihydroxy-2-naphthoate octaprenyltransferase [Gammaproteobacteria bacterium]|nr:1,4-dihydroxy-2-naphthoate octaprenyltransferase [Gammaproteobacteria bacterium]MDH3372075.1 1,4-dihydroxy-2-naphthoate octaprenyltransferase [Gammaproteobacteria bacterium]MDH3407872.1 1,4-dihydroxy-2-naphthoate octaprenyltransferase [Gammaproteobacteria bacterium]MDH3551703.1 1,4-dihydroxy-2-naphthoate octaprenyltransferase [Gammaproteobacteria bacterium]
MPTENARAVDPSPQNFSGDTFAQTAKRLFHATRPKFFPASLLPVIAGTAWGFSTTGSLGIVVFMLALFATVCVHAASNVLNDVGDDSGGTDRQNDDRVYPYTGGSRFIQTGIMSASEMAHWGITLLALAAIAGIALIALKGPMVLYFGLAGVTLSVLYSLGPARLASLGVGETAVALGFGIIPVAGAAWLQGAELNTELLLFSIPVSAWVAAILLINEVPDVAPDGATGKRTLPVRLGLSATAVVYMLLHVAAVAATGRLTYNDALPLLAPLVPAALLILAFRAGAAIRVGIQDRGRMTAAIESTLAIHTSGSIWLAACVLYLHWWP